MNFHMIDEFNEKYILNFTPTGLIPTKQMTPYVPIQINEIIVQGLEVAEIAVNMVHRHARDSENDEQLTKRRFIPRSFPAGMINYAKYLIKKGAYSTTLLFQFNSGQYLLKTYPE